MIQQQNGPGTVKAHTQANGPHGATSSLTTGYSPEYATIGWEASCDHDDDSGRSVVLDPFAGAGTVGVVCGWHGREFIGIELNPEYAAMARERIALEGRPGGRPAVHEPTKVHDGQLGFEAA